MIPMVMLADGATTAASLVTTVTDMAGNMLTTMAENPMLSVFIGIPIAAAVVGLVGRLMRRH